MEREGFSSRFGALVVIAGSAVGLGNIWRFPYMVGANGGAAFILIYLFFVVMICLPIMIAEILIGRRSRRNAFGSFAQLKPGSKFWKIVGIIYIVIPTLVLSYYCLIGGVTIEYFFRSCGLDLQSNTWTTVGWTVAFLALTGLIVLLGVQNGIERFSKVMMPLLFVIVVLIAIRSMTLPTRVASDYTAMDGIAFLFKPDFSKVTAKTWIAALGQAFFSLSIGSGVLMTYGSYVRPKDHLVKTVGEIAFFDLIFAIIAGCAVIPAVFALKDNPLEVLSQNTDSALVFNILPNVFPQMPFGNFVGILFFFALILAALTSSLSQFEVPVSYLVDEKKMSRKPAVVIVFVIAFVIGLACALRGQVMNFLDALCANWLMPIGGVLAVVFLGWMMKNEDILDELSGSGTSKVSPRFVKCLKFVVRYIAPVGVLAVFLSQIL